MKLNGALKPRQGASNQGSSPGVVLKEYRVKRYFKVNKNVVNGQPLNARGAKIKKSAYDNNIINSIYYNSINNQQRVITSHSHQLEEHKGNCVVALNGGICISLSRIKSSTSIRIRKQIKFSTHDNAAQFKISAVTKTDTCHNYLKRHKSNYNILQKIAGIVAERESSAELYSVKERHIKRNININIDIDDKAITNITARQLENKKLKKEIVTYNHITARNGMKTKQVNNKKFEKRYHNNASKEESMQVNKFVFVPKINTNSNLNLKAIISYLKLMVFSIFLHAIRYFNGKIFNNFANICSKTMRCFHLFFRRVDYNIAKMMRASHLVMSLFKSICLKNAKRSKSSVALFMVIYAATAILLPQAVVGDDGDTFFPVNGIETTTPEFDYASRGQKKFGDKCENTLECGFPGSICDPKKKSCQCTEDLPVTNHIDKCGKEAAVNESCFFNEQCEVKYFQTECRDQRCVCRFDMTPIWLKDGSVECKGRGDKKGPETYIDPAMIGVLIGMALMFIIICVVLRLFSQARWRENRTIFNTPNPRLMNVSLLRESKLLHGQERRGSRMSVRAPSRQPSMASLRPHSPNPSLGKTGRMTRSKSNTRSSDSRVSDASNCSRLLEHHAANTHHAAHSHANAISPHSSSTNHGAQTSVSPISLNAPTTIITNINETPAAETIASSTNLPTTKTNKF